jgi:hypothetical protein
MKLLAQSRSLSFKAKRKGDIVLRQEARRLRNLARFELKRFQQAQLAKHVEERNLPGDASTLFWSRTKRFFRTVSSSLRGFLQHNGEIIKDPQIMANLAADYYEKLFEAPVVIRPHPYVDAPQLQWENESEQIPLVTYPEILNVLRTRKKNLFCFLLSSFGLLSLFSFLVGCSLLFFRISFSEVFSFYFFINFYHLS